MKINTTDLAKIFIKENVSIGNTVIDATMGRGNDTLLLCNLVGENGKVFAFDIQEEAISATKRKLSENNFINIATLILDGHENMDRYVKEKVDCVVFNFGYLPRTDHSISTKPETSVAAIKKAMNLLRPNGIISLCVYSGKDTGFEEKETILQFLKSVDYNKYTIIYTDFFNRPNNPPIHIKIIKEQA